MAVRLAEEVSAQVPADDFQALEEKVYRTIELYKSARDARSAAERDTRAGERLAEVGVRVRRVVTTTGARARNERREPQQPRRNAHASTLRDRRRRARLLTKA